MFAKFLHVSNDVCESGEERAGQHVFSQISRVTTINPITLLGLVLCGGSCFSNTRQFCPQNANFTPTRRGNNFKRLLHCFFLGLLQVPAQNSPISPDSGNIPRVLDVATVSVSRSSSQILILFVNYRNVPPSLLRRILRANSKEIKRDFVAFYGNSFGIPKIIRFDSYEACHSFFSGAVAELACT